MVSTARKQIAFDPDDQLESERDAPLPDKPFNIVSKKKQKGLFQKVYGKFFKAKAPAEEEKKPKSKQVKFIFKG
jgi:hypothetical protein